MRMKVFIIDEAHMLTREGANAFLKTLEEPPPHAVFILATTAPEALPATILSRCQRYAFRRIPVAVMIARMREIADAEGITIDDGALGAIAYRADGGLRDALTMLEQVASYAGGAVDAATVDAAFGATGRQYARALVDAILGGEAATALRVVDEASDAGADMLGLVRGAIAEYRNLLVARIDPELLSRDLSNADAEAVGALAAGTPQPKVVRGLRLLADALAAGRASGNPRLELETAVLRLIVQGEDPSLEALATRVALLEGGAPTAPAPVVRSARAVPDPSPVTAAPMPARAEPAVHAQPPITTAAPAVEPTSAPVASAPAPTLQQVRSLWDQIRLRVEEQSKPLRGPLSRATVDSLAGNALTISVPDDVNESILRDKLPLIESAIADSLRVPLRLVLRNRAVRNGDAHRAAPAAVREAASPEPQDGEVNLLAYARKKIGGTETS
jgi:DNA polymerase-3 subunit gamma/tau